nr:hypothetical protein [Corynebacterium diphtheriae]
MSAHSDHGFATRSIHAGYEPDLRLNELRGGFEYTAVKAEQAPSPQLSTPTSPPMSNTH